MKVLLDTHAFLWLMSDHPNLSQKARDTFLDKNNELFLSSASMWEICIKISIGKLTMNQDWQIGIKNEMKTNGIRWLDIKMEHCFKVEKLPFHHRDPFDRILIAQAIIEAMILMTCDPLIYNYDVEYLW